MSSLCSVWPDPSCPRIVPTPTGTLGSGPICQEPDVSPRSKPETLPEVPGFTELPPGKIAAVATYLEMFAPPAALRPVPAPRFGLEPIAGDIARYRALFAIVGRPWLWFSRAGASDNELGTILGNPDVEAFAVMIEGQEAGLLELNFRAPRECELAFFGLTSTFTGKGFGRPLIAEAIHRAFARPIERLWLHTCTLDHPAALPFYMKAGFQPYRRALEVADDPRLTGRLPRDAAPGVPIL